MSAVARAPDEAQLKRLNSPAPAAFHEQEQEQGLLDAWKAGQLDDDQELKQAEGIENGRSPSTTSQRQQSCSRTVSIAALAAALLLIVIGSWIFLKRASVAENRDDDLSRIKSNEYILDPNWDFEAPPQKRQYDFTIRDQVHNPDGIFRPMILVNNQFPGPLIEANEGDTIVVHVSNEAINATSIHWHGMYQKGTPYMDGTVGVTQCPIASGGSFTYEFTVSGQSGTYWWHAHQGVQSSDGAHGPLVIHSRNEKTLRKNEYQSDRVVLIADHYHDLSAGLLWSYLASGMENTEPVPLTGLINGRAIRDCDDFPQRRCDNTSAHVGMPTIDLAPNQRHRLRLVNVGAFAEFQVQVDEHELAVTEVDGTDVNPQNYHRININPAQRYSVILDTNSSTSDVFWFRARMITKCFTDAPKNMDPDALAIIRYAKPDIPSNTKPSSQDWEETLQLQCKDMNTSQLTPVDPVRAPEASAFFYIRSNFEIGAYQLARGFFNKSSWRPRVRSPTLHRALDGLSSSNATYQSLDSSTFVNEVAFDTNRELVIQTSSTQVVDILFSNFDDGNHPLHLHGYKYFVLAQGHGYPPLTHRGADINRENLAPLYDSLDLSNPLRRDTASVEAFGWILIRIVADNPGTWALHCHVSWHAEAGLMMQLLTNTDDLSKMQIPDESLQLCAGKDLETGMAPDDEVYRRLAEGAG